MLNRKHFSGQPISLTFICSVQVPFGLFQKPILKKKLIFDIPEILRGFVMNKMSYQN